MYTLAKSFKSLFLFGSRTNRAYFVDVCSCISSYLVYLKSNVSRQRWRPKVIHRPIYSLHTNHQKYIEITQETEPVPVDML